MGEGSEEVCNKIFRFMAAAKRPLSPEELGEAISVEPCQPFLMPDRLLNDVNGIVRWCHGLIVLNELDDTLQLTHSSVKDFLCGPETERITLSGFHFEEHEANRQFGEICVTYLCFNDFKTQVVKYHRPGTPLNPMMMASHALNAGSSSFVLNQAKNMVSRRAKSASASSSRLLSLQTSSRKNRETMSKYQLLQYASEFWLLHTTDFLPDQGRIWSLFRTLAEECYHTISRSVVRTPMELLPEDDLYNSMYTHKHQALFRLYLGRFWDDKHRISILASILTYKCYPFLSILPPLAIRGHELSWQELVLSLSTYDLFQTMTLSRLEWLEDLTDAERSRILLMPGPHTNMPMKEWLIELGVDPYYESINYGKHTMQEHTTLLEWVIRSSEVTLLEMLCKVMINSGTDLGRKITKDGRNALHVAAAVRNSAAVSTLLDHSSSQTLINSTDDYYSTALHFAVKGEASAASQYDLIDTVQILIEMGASMRAKDGSGKVAFEYASVHDLYLLRKRFSEFDQVETAS